MIGSEICNKGNCTGCMACMNACPKQCITMNPIKLGHWYPKVDQSKCINCGLCAKVCPENSDNKFTRPLKAYASWHKDKTEYLTSTSGGASAALSRLIINKGGVVYGCVAQNGIRISHIRIDNLADLQLLKGSKYVQSDIGFCYENIKRDLNENRLVLFIGTPCQSAGLQSYLGRDYENLYRVDLICHGVPSQTLLKNHIKNISKDKGFKVCFRQGNDMGLRIYDSDDNLIYYSNVWRNRYKDIYYNAFIDGYTYRDSCYRCQYARPERQSDITIGDFWGLGKDFEYDTVNGCSCILPVTQKGQRLVNEAALHLYERDITEAVQGNGQLQHPKKLTKRIKLFRKLFTIIGVKNAYLLCEFDHILDFYFLKPILRRLKR